MLKMRIRTNQKQYTWNAGTFLGNLFVLVFTILFIYGGIQYIHILVTNLR